MRSSKSLIVLALTFSLGLHWMFLQSVAWMSMVVDYSRSASLQEAVAKTFDGAHPCKLCKLVRAGKEKEQKQDIQKPLRKFEFLRSNGNEIEIAFLPYSHGAPRMLTFETRDESPPTPPPRPTLG